MTGHHLEEIAAPEGLDGGTHCGGILSGRVVARAFHGVRRRVRLVGAIPGHALGARPIELELVTVSGGLLAAVIDDEDLVRQVKHQVALVGIPRQALAHGLELEGKLIAERTVESEVGVLRAEGRADGAQDREYRRLSAAQFLGKPLVGLAHCSAYAVLRHIECCQSVEIFERLTDGCEQ